MPRLGTVPRMASGFGGGSVLRPATVGSGRCRAQPVHSHECGSRAGAVSLALLALSRWSTGAAGVFRCFAADLRWDGPGRGCSDVGCDVGQDRGVRPQPEQGRRARLDLLLHLVRAAWLSAGFQRGRRPFTLPERWQTSYLPACGAWAAVVVLVFPPAFAFA